MQATCMVSVAIHKFIQRISSICRRSKDRCVHAALQIGRGKCQELRRWGRLPHQSPRTRARSTPMPHADGPLLIDPAMGTRGTRELAIGIIGSHIVLTFTCSLSLSLWGFLHAGACELRSIRTACNACKYEHDPFSYMRPYSCDCFDLGWNF